MDHVLIDHSDREHADFAPSSLKRLLNCHGSYAAQVGIEGVSSAAAEEGTECHEASSLILTDHSWEEATKDLSEEQEWIVTEYTSYAFDLIARLIEKHGKKNVVVWVETRVRSNTNDRNHGTADLIIWVKPLRTVAVIDLKAGHVMVDVGTPEDPNAQLANYGFLSLDHHDLWDEVDFIRLTIFQPRVFEKAQTVTLTKSQLRKFAAKVDDHLAEIEDGDEARNAGEWCKFCLAAGACPTLKKHVQDKARMVFDKAGKPEHPRNYTPDELLDILADAEALKAHYEGVQVHVMREMEKGRLWGNGFKLVQKRATAKWLDHDALVSEFSGVGGKHLLFKPKALTPNQLADVLKKEGIEFDLTDYFVKESSGVSLVTDDDPRPAYRPDPFKDKANE